MDDPCPVSSRRGSSLASYLVVYGFGSATDGDPATSLDDGVSATGILVVVSGYVIVNSLSFRIWLSALVMQFVVVAPSLFL